jgi:stage III sporulation protein AG
MNELYWSFFDPKGKYGIWGIFCLVLVGILLMVLPGFLFGEKKERPLSDQSQKKLAESAELNLTPLLELEKQFARQAEEILNQGEGFGKVSVAVTLEAGPEQDLARNVQNQVSVVEEQDAGGGKRVTSETQEEVKYVIAQGGETPLVLREKNAQIKGVLVMAEGAVNPEIKRLLSEAMQSLFALPAHRVMILPMKGR